MKLDKRMVVIAVAAFAIAWFVATNQGNSVIPNPFVPQKPDRPVLRFIAKVAKTVLWVAVFAEPRPQPQSHYVQTQIGPDGHECLNHAEGF